MIAKEVLRRQLLLLGIIGFNDVTYIESESHLKRNVEYAYSLTENELKVNFCDLFFVFGSI